MNRRNFSLSAGALGLVSLTGGVLAQQPVKPAGQGFRTLANPVRTEVPTGKVEVVELFSYNCPHCAAFEPELEQWLKKLPDYVEFRRIPVNFVGSDFEAKQRLYYTLEALGKLDTHHSQVFTAIHNKGENLTGDERTLAWAAKQPDLDGKKFADMYKSFSVVGKAKRATQLTDAYRPEGVPALIIDGRYYVDGTSAGTIGRMLDVGSTLVKQQHKG
ncbi:MAG: thiol:disulfide interchange protein DsbA/DsbL [Variovorax sp.]